MPESDRRQFDELRARQREACERLVREHYEGLYGWLYRLTGCRHRAEDLTQESFAAFWASLERSSPGVSPRTWLYAIARNQWRKQCRNDGAGRKREEADLEQLAAGDESPAAALEHREFAEALEAAVAALAAEFREVFTLRVWQGFDYAEIAAVQGISPELARWRFFRARRTIRDRLSAWEHVEEKRRGE